MRPLTRANAVWLLCLALLTPACSWLRKSAPLEERVKLIAVMPIEREEPSAPSASKLAPGAERVVTAHVYGVLSASSTWRFVPDLTATQALSRLGRGGDLASRAQSLGQTVGADAVIFGTISHYVERVGSDYGAREPASVSFTLQLVSVPTGAILWKDSFDETQQALSSNLLNWWQFWRGGPRWFSAEEFTRLGVERLLEDLERRIS